MHRHIYTGSSGVVALLVAFGCDSSAGKNTVPSATGDSSATRPASIALQTAAPGKGIAVDVSVKSLTVRGDTVGISYVLYARPESRDSLANFAVDAPSGVQHIPTPLPIEDWWVSPSFKGRKIAYWARLGALPPGTTSVPLYFEALGLPGIVTYWIVGQTAVPEGEGDDTVTRDALRDNSIIGKSVGVEKAPLDGTPQALPAHALLTRLRSLTEASCANSLRWITDPALCSQLLTNIQQAIVDYSSGRTGQAKQALAHYRDLLGAPAEAETGRATSAGYWLLRSNAEIVEKRM